MAANQQQQQASPQKLPPCINTSGVTTLSPGHQDIIDSHANSQWNAGVYVAVVLLIYALALIIVTVQRVRNERSQVRLTLLYHSFWRRTSSSKNKNQQQDGDLLDPPPIPSVPIIMPPSPPPPNNNRTLDDDEEEECNV